MSSNNKFAELGLAPNLVTALAELGYETPTPIQERSIPALLDGKDLLAQAQTGTGKTAAFALPILTRLKKETLGPQALILTPTRELSIQVSEAFQSYAKHLSGFQVLPIYGGADYRPQLTALKRGVHVVVGTPGRVMDHLRRGTLQLGDLKIIVLDEADEMLKMGFIEDIQWILQQISGEHQTALFSATIPDTIKQISSRYLKDPIKIHIEPKEKTVAAIDQHFTLVAVHNKLSVLTRFLEAEEFDAAIIFTRTKNSSSELAEKLQARGYRAAALNGDLSQALREKVVKQLKNKMLDIIVATEVAARGLDVERIGYVINYDIPHDPESYVHRIGRTGRAGRKGKALLFVTPRERNMLRSIERMLQQPIPMIDPPSANQIHEQRDKHFTDRVVKVIAEGKLTRHREMVERLMAETENSVIDIAAALAYLANKEKQPVDVIEESREKAQFEPRERHHGDRGARGDRRDRKPSSKPREKSYSKSKERGQSERSHSERSRPERGQSEGKYSERSKPERSHSEKGRSERNRFEKSGADRSGPEKRHADARKKPLSRTRAR